VCLTKLSGILSGKGALIVSKVLSRQDPNNPLATAADAAVTLEKSSED